MRFQVPQYVEIEDKLAFKLTLKQLGWFAAGGAILFVFWTIFTKLTFWISFPFVVGLSVAFAFYKPAGLTLITFIIDGFKYFFQMKELVWEKKSENIFLEDKYGKRQIDMTETDQARVVKGKQKKIKNIGSLAKILDESSDL